MSTNWCDIDHGGRRLADHCLGVGHLLQSAGADTTLIRCGMMHVIFGAESYSKLNCQVVNKGAHLLRPEEVELIWQYSRVNEASLYIAGLTRNAGFLTDRETGRPICAATTKIQEIIILLYANIMEQFTQYPMPAEIAQQERDLRGMLEGLRQLCGNVGDSIAGIVASSEGLRVTEQQR